MIIIIEIIKIIDKYEEEIFSKFTDWKKVILIEIIRVRLTKRINKLKGIIIIIIEIFNLVVTIGVNTSLRPRRSARRVGNQQNTRQQ